MRSSNSHIFWTAEPIGDAPIMPKDREEIVRITANLATSDFPTVGPGAKVHLRVEAYDQMLEIQRTIPSKLHNITSLR